MLSEIDDDLALTHPMNRLLQGEVGSGKTLVSLLAALRAVDNAISAPSWHPPKSWPRSTTGP